MKTDVSQTPHTQFIVIKAPIRPESRPA